MTGARKAAVVVGALRIAYGVALVVAPGRLTRSWIGSDGARPAAGVMVRAVGAREIFLHIGMIAAASRGRPARPWLAASIAGDFSDICATAAASGEVPEHSPAMTAAVAGGSALISAVVAAAVDA